MDETKQQPKRRVWLKVLFAVSVALNLGILGAVAGAAWRHGGADGRPGAGGPPGGLSMLRALEREDRRAVLTAARAAKPSGGLDRRALQAAFIAGLRADPVDFDMLADILEQQRSEANARLGAVSQAWLARVEEMSVEARLAYADRLEAGGKRHKKSSD